MKVFEGLAAVDPPLRKSILTIGNFDGMHLAHQALLAECRRLASTSGGPMVVLTFDPHPLTVVAPERVPRPLMPLDEKLRLFEMAGADLAVVARSEPALLNLEADAFIEEVIRRRFDPAHVVEGPSFGFGKGRKGTPEVLTRAGREFGWDVHIVPPVSVRIDGDSTVLVSSSLIRGLLTQSRVADAGRCLGRDYALFGTVTHGQGRGRTIGFPTANVAPGNQVIPADGVYAGRACVDERLHACAISIGHTPTFGGQERQIEAHLLDFHDDLYGQTIALEFTRFLRSQQTFASTRELMEQLRRDVEAVRGPTTHARSLTAAGTK